MTDHANLLQEHSQLYHHLSLFETETKRKLAMESRRIEMLSPMLVQLNKASYEVLHKQARQSKIHFFNYSQRNITICNYCKIQNYNNLDLTDKNCLVTDFL